MGETGFTLFDTAIGRCAIAWSPRGIARILLPATRDNDLRARMARDTGAAEADPPANIVSAIDMSGALRAVPIVEPEVTSTIGLVVSKRYPIRPTIAFLIEEARKRELLAAS